MASDHVPSVLTDEGGASAKKHVGMLRDVKGLASKAYSSRITYAWIGTGGKGSLHLLSVYVWIREGMTERNKAILTHVSRVTKSLKRTMDPS